MRIFIIFLLLLPSFAKASAGKQDKGDKAPEFTLKNQEGKEVKLADLKEKKNVLLAFYPKDATPGWTKEMQALRDNIKKFEDRGCTVLGISMDDVDSHKKFCGDQKLPFDLLSDKDKKVHEAYGFKGMTRALFLIDKSGKLVFVNKKFDLKKESWDDLWKAVDALEK